MPMAEVNELAVKLDSEGGGRDERSRAPWILSDKVAIAQCRLPKWASPSGTMSSKTRDAIVPGGEKWAGTGLQYGILSFPNARDLITPGEFGREFQVLPSNLSISARCASVLGYAPRATSPLQLTILHVARLLIDARCLS